MLLDSDSSEEEDTHYEFNAPNTVSVVLRCGRKRLRLSMDLDEDEKFEEWITEDLAKKAGICIRSFWMHNMYMRRCADGEFVRVCIPYYCNYPNKFYKYFRMSTATFDYVLAHIKARITKHSRRLSISPMERLAVTLRYLSTGLSFQALSDSFLMSPYTISLIVNEVCGVIFDTFVDKHMAVPSRDQFKQIAADYEDQWDFPHVIGAIDGKHIRMKCPPNGGSMFYNYKGYHSVVLQAVSDSYYKFLFVDVGAYGKQGDAGTFAASTLSAFVENPDNFPADSMVVGVKYPVPFLFVCDDAYPLRWNMLKPYPGANLTPAQQIFNGRLSRARRCVECSFGILANKWRLLLKEIDTGVESACTAVKAMTILHNLIIDKEGVNSNLLQLVKEKLHENRKNPVITGGRYNRSTIAAGRLREALTEYFSSDDGSVLWQERYVKYK